MPNLRVLSGWDVIAIYRNFGFEVASTRGSHAKVRRISATGAKETLTVPLHAELDAGTCRALMRQASRYVPLDQLREHFYTE